MGACPMMVGQLVQLNAEGQRVGWFLPPGLGRVEKVEGTACQELTVGVRWVNWAYGHDLHDTWEQLQQAPPPRRDGWWCHPSWLDALTPEEATLWWLGK